MTEVQFHASQKRAHELGERLHHALTESGDQHLAALASRISTEVHEIPKLVFTGQYSSGKSTLISALTDGKATVIIDSDISTDEVAEYDWDGYVALVDTPGVQAGLDRHDEIAERALVTADLVLFAVTVDLFDDQGISHLRHVASDLGKRDQMLIVITKANTMPAPPEVRRAAVLDALGPDNAAIPFIECDARDYLDGKRHQDPARSAAYVSRSNMDVLRSAINQVSSRRGDLARFAQPLQAIHALAMEAEMLLVDDPDEAAVLALLARQRSALSARRERIDGKLDELASRFVAASGRVAEQFADDVESIDELVEGPARQGRIDDFTRSLHAGLAAHAEQMAADMQRVLEQQFDDLASEVREIEAMPHARVALKVVHGGDIESPDTGFEVAGGDPHKDRSRPLPSWASDASKWLRQFEHAWGAGGGMRASAGSQGHEVVLNVGRFFGKKFQPWEAVRVADRVGKAAKIGGAVISIATGIGAVVLEERALVKAEGQRVARRRAVVIEVQVQAQTIARDTVRNVRQQVDASFQTAYTEVDLVHAQIIGNRRDRTSVALELQGIRENAEQALEQLASP